MIPYSQEYKYDDGSTLFEFALLLMNFSLKVVVYDTFLPNQPDDSVFNIYYWCDT
jgi:hypothetical protein